LTTPTGLKRLCWEGICHRDRPVAPVLCREGPPGRHAAYGADRV